MIAHWCARVSLSLNGRRCHTDSNVEPILRRSIRVRCDTYPFPVGFGNRIGISVCGKPADKVLVDGNCAHKVSDAVGPLTNRFRLSVTFQRVGKLTLSKISYPLSYEISVVNILLFGFLFQKKLVVAFFILSCLSSRDACVVGKSRWVWARLWAGCGQAHFACPQAVQAQRQSCPCPFCVTYPPRTLIEAIASVDSDSCFPLISASKRVGERYPRLECKRSALYQHNQSKTSALACSRVSYLAP